jgi:DNA-directed RNA polymerase subunit beta'
MVINIDVNNFDAIRVGLASPEKIKSWSNGEVKKPETINYRTLKPEKDGLFCERIFGPTKDWECYCGKYKRVRFKGIICERCGVEVTRSNVRRERMGHISLAAPVSHIWFFKGVPSRMGYVLDISPRDLEKVLYFDSYIVTSVNSQARQSDKERISQLPEEAVEKAKELHELRLVDIEENKIDLLNKYKDGDELRSIEEIEDEEIVSEKDIEAKVAKIIKEAGKLLVEENEIFAEELELIKRAQTFFMNLEEKMLVLDEPLFKKMKEIYKDYFDGGMGAEAVKELLKSIDVNKDVEELKAIIKESKGQKRIRAIKRLKILSVFKDSTNKPEHMIVEILPVIPPDLRPMVQLDGGRFATSDLNDLYRRVINRNNRLKKLLELNAPEIIINNEKRMLQEAVDSLFDNGRRGRAVLGAGNRPLKSLSDMLKGKQGRFRQNLLGKRVDYSGRSVIVVNPHLKLYQCGLPKAMALELFKPFVMKELVEKGYVQNIKSAKTMVDRGSDEVWDVLEQVIKNHPVLLNRAPTLHRLGIQAFLPILVEGKAIQIHPLVCPPFNADFDGDQMAVHVPLSNEAKSEALVLMLASNNILSPASGLPVSIPSQDMVLGLYYLTSDRINKGAKPKYKKMDGYFYNSVEEALIDYDYGFITLHSPIKAIIKKAGKPKAYDTTIGRIILNQALPEDYEFVNREINKKSLVSIISDCINKYPASVVTKILDNIKEIGFKYATRSGITVAIEDIVVPEKKKEILEAAERKIEKAESHYNEGLLSDGERHQIVITTWSQATEDVADAMEKNFDKHNSVYMMATSGARGNIKQLRQLAGMRGLVANARGDILDRPIKSNFREGATVLEYFISTHGARQGLADTALRTADSGYLTRRLVDVAQETIVRINDCGTEEGVSLYVLTLEGEPNQNLIGRTNLVDVINAKTKKIILKAGEEIKEKDREALIHANVEYVKVRSGLTCESEFGVCQQCYGRDLASGKLIAIGEAVGIIAAQSIGEPGTQLTMRTFHTGGVASTVIIRNVKSPVTGRLVLREELLEQLHLKKEDFTDEKSDESREVNIEHVVGRLTFQVSMENGNVVDIIIPKGEVLQLNKSTVVEEGHVFAKIVLTAKRKLHVHKHEKTFEGIDITSGLPRVVELFEARRPKEHAFISETSGIASIEDVDPKFRMITIKNSEDGMEKTYQVPTRTKIRVNDGEYVNTGDQLTEGIRNPHDILKINGIKACEQYLVKEIQDVYKSQGVDINDKHIEIIVRQMLKRVTVIDQGDSQFLPGALVDRLIFEKENKKLSANSKEPATAKTNLMGITKASLATDSFLAAASFQETTKVLTDAALENKVDYLVGLKENVIIGKAIPAGTGLIRYRDVDLIYAGYKEEPQEEVELFHETGDDEKLDLDMEMNI